MVSLVKRHKITLNVKKTQCSLLSILVYGKMLLSAYFIVKSRYWVQPVRMRHYSGVCAVSIFRRDLKLCAFCLIIWVLSLILTLFCALRFYYF